MTPLSSYALAASRHIHEYGTTREQLAQVAVSARQWDQRNPDAFVREELTVSDCLHARMVSDSLSVRDCCHPGMYGLFLLVENCLQLRGAAGERQVAEAELGLCHANGGTLSSQSTVVLGTAATL